MENLYKDDMGIINLTSYDFTLSNSDKKLDSNIKISNINFKNSGLINFYAPWCGHCQKFVPIWIELTNLFKNKFKLGAFNCDDIFHNNEKICQTLKIKQYPTIMYVDKKGNIKNYKGLRTKEELIYFITSSSNSLHSQ